MALNELYTLIVGLGGLLVGGFLLRKVPGMSRLSMPVSVLGGVLVSVIVLIIQMTSGLEISFATGLRDLLLLAFFTAIGLSAKLSSLRAGGRKLAVLCGMTVLLLVIQDLVGILMALARGAHPFYGLLVGSLSFVGGPGTAIAWSAHAGELGLPMAAEIGLGSATLATLAGALVAAPLTDWLIRRRGLHSEQQDGNIVMPEKQVTTDTRTPAERQMAIFRTLALISVSVAIGARMNTWARAHDVLLPGFLTAMLAGALISNLFDLFRINIDTEVLEHSGGISLQLFLVLSLMGLQLWVIGKVILPLLLNMLIQIIFTVLIALLLLFRLLGRDYDAAVTSGAFIGFGLASMPVAFATIDELTSRHGPSPMGLLLVTLVGSFFVDIANATVTKLFLMLPIFS